MSRRKKPRAPASHGADDKLHAWEAAVKVRVLSFEVDKLSSGLAIARWLPFPGARRRDAFVYHLPAK